MSNSETEVGHLQAIKKINAVVRSITFIQRVNTTGGLAPSVPGLLDGETKEIPYTAEYYFYRAENPNSN